MTGTPGRYLDVALYDFGEEYAEGSIGAHFLEDSSEGVCGVAVSPEAPPQVQRAYVVEARGYAGRRAPKGGRRTMLHCSDPERLDRNAIMAIRCVVEDIAPEWFEEVKEATKISNHPRVIAGYCEISVSVVVAVLEILRARGELPEGEEGAA